MKTRLLLSICLLVSPAGLYAQLLLNEGATWTYEFTSLPHQGFVSSFGVNPNGRFEFLVNAATFGSGDRLMYQMFESSTAEAPIYSGTLDSVPPNILSSQVDNAWQDVQGMIRFTMLSGSAVVESITLETTLSGPSLSSYEVRSDTFVPIPEPGTLAVFGGGLIFGALLLRRRR